MHNDYRYNGSGISDPTAGVAMQRTDRLPDNVQEAINRMREVAEWYGCECVGRIWLRDNKSGREYR